MMGIRMGTLRSIQTLGICMGVTLLSACQILPTEMKQEYRDKAHDQIKLEDLRINDSTIVVDTRPHLEYEIRHWPSSVHMSPSEWSKKESPSTLAKRLALLGIAPNSSVLVLGNSVSQEKQNHQQAISAGQIALFLRWLGVQNVQMVEHTALSAKMMLNQNHRPQNANFWDPILNEEVFCGDANASVLKKALDLNKTPLQSQIQILDSRKEQVYLKDSRLQSGGQFKIMNIPWFQTVDSVGRPSKTVAEVLLSQGFSRDEKIYVIGDGQQDFATEVLLELGFKACSLPPSFSNGTEP